MWACSPALLDLDGGGLELVGSGLDGGGLEVGWGLQGVSWMEELSSLCLLLRISLVCCARECLELWVMWGGVGVGGGVSG